jgi:hypothetical protein
MPCLTKLFTQMATNTPEIKRLPKDVADYKLSSFDQGVFMFELLKLGITPHTTPLALVKAAPPGLTDGKQNKAKDSKVAVQHNPYDQGVVEGTVYGTLLALTQMFTIIEEKYVTSIPSFFHKANNSQVCHLS